MSDQVNRRDVLKTGVAAGAAMAFTAASYDRVLGANVDFFEAREMVQGNEAVVKYSVTMSPGTSLVWLNKQLMAEGSGGLKSVSWAEPTKKG